MVDLMRPLSEISPDAGEFALMSDAFWVSVALILFFIGLLIFKAYRNCLEREA